MLPCTAKESAIHTKQNIAHGRIIFSTVLQVVYHAFPVNSLVKASKLYYTFAHMSARLTPFHNLKGYAIPGSLLSLYYCFSVM